MLSLYAIIKWLRVDSVFIWFKWIIYDRRMLIFLAQYLIRESVVSFLWDFDLSFPGIQLLWENHFGAIDRESFIFRPVVYKHRLNMGELVPNFIRPSSLFRFAKCFFQNIFCKRELYFGDHLLSNSRNFWRLLQISAQFFLKILLQFMLDLVFQFEANWWLVRCLEIVKKLGVIVTSGYVFLHIRLEFLFNFLVETSTLLLFYIP